MGSSPRPVGLQRMFTAAAPTTEMPAPTLLRHRTAVQSGTTTTESLPGTPSSVPAGQPHHHEVPADTITFDTAQVQRELDVARAADPAGATAPESGAPATVVATTAAPTPAAPWPDVDQLLDKLYDPLVARLRAELWLDRERAGMLMDLGR